MQRGITRAIAPTCCTHICPIVVDLKTNINYDIFFYLTHKQLKHCLKKKRYDSSFTQKLAHNEFHCHISHNAVFIKMVTNAPLPVTGLSQSVYPYKGINLNFGQKIR